MKKRPLVEVVDSRNTPRPHTYIVLGLFSTSPKDIVRQAWETFAIECDLLERTR